MLNDHPIKKEIDRAVSKFEGGKYRSPSVDRVISNMLWFASGIMFGFTICLSLVSC